MNELKLLKEKYSTYPTIMDIRDEIIFIEDFMKISIDTCKENPLLFFELLDILNESHINGGIFEVTDDNLPIFHNFARWLRNVNIFMNSDKLEVYATDFEGKFDD